MGDVPLDRQAVYRAAMEDVIAYYADRYAVEAPEFALYIGADVDAARDVYREVGGPNPDTYSGWGRVVKLGGTRAIFTGITNPLLLAHEYFHVLQKYLSDNTTIVSPRWLVEGSAVYESMVYYYGNYDGYRKAAVSVGANLEGSLRDLEHFDQTDLQYMYALGSLASEWLLEELGKTSQVDYWKALAESTTWEAAFSSAFGMTADDFYEAFEQHVAALIAELPVGRAGGVVLGPGGEPVDGIGVRVEAEETLSTWFAETTQDGTFDLHVLTGTHTIKLFVREGSSWRHVGWYGGDDGFTTDVGQATVLDVDDGDVVDIQIRLPANPADLREAQIPRVQGTVLGPGGEPATGIGLWLWGGSTDNSKFAGNSSDGTFDLDHQNGTFTLRIYTLEDGAWRQIGWYGGERGFTADFDQATAIEVDGTDVTGIEIRLPALPADLPTIE